MYLTHFKTQKTQKNKNKRIGHSSSTSGINKLSQSHRCKALLKKREGREKREKVGKREVQID